MCLPMHQVGIETDTAEARQSFLALAKDGRSRRWPQASSFEGLARAVLTDKAIAIFELGRSADPLQASNAFEKNKRSVLNSADFIGCMRRRRIVRINRLAAL
jgi:hypothetical protein